MSIKSEKGDVGTKPRRRRRLSGLDVEKMSEQSSRLIQGKCRDISGFGPHLGSAEIRCRYSEVLQDLNVGIEDI